MVSTERLAHPHTPSTSFLPSFMGAHPVRTGGLGEAPQGAPRALPCPSAWTHPPGAQIELSLVTPVLRSPPAPEPCFQTPPPMETGFQRAGAMHSRIGMSSWDWT